MAETGPIRWREWDPGVFTQAETEGKLVFLDISATWCHWCHVLDRTSLSDPRVVGLLNDSFLPVRVDTDRRPDINERYNQGGWPTTAVLLPNGQLLTGATYLPPDSLFEVLRKCADFYRQDRGRIERYLAETAAPSAPAADEEEPASAPPGGPHPDDLSLVKHSVLARYDPLHPGFFREPKFPVPEILSFLRDAWVLEGNREAKDVFLKVLRTMGSSPLFDAVEGGFFRYATRRDWTAPHYEKLLADNAEMLSLYAFAFERTGEEWFAGIARRTASFLFSRLRDPRTGAFFPSQDADEEYYLGDAEGRARRPAPSVDRTVISEYNGRAVSGLVSAHRAFGGDLEIPAAAGRTLLELAGKLGEFLRANLWDAGEGQVRFRENGAAESGHLADNVSVAEAHLDLWEAGGGEKYLAWAGEALDGSVRRFFSPKAFGFLDRLPRAGDAGTLHLPIVPFSLNARMACALLRYSRAAERTDLYAVAELTLKGLSAEFGARAAFGAPYGSALLEYGKGSRGTACLPGDPSCASGGASSTGFRGG
ncbi:MAG: thioredoxin domain-containing protein [Deltaproteobacteria bacterium]|nr:thioredoxin domain-containing protein [Deltaproteobacteria bacterium]